MLFCIDNLNELKKYQKPKKVQQFLGSNPKIQSQNFKLDEQLNMTTTSKRRALEKAKTGCSITIVGP